MTSLVDGVSFTAVSSGTGTFVFGTSRASFITPAQAVANGTLTDGDTVSYLAQDSPSVPTEREWGHGTFSTGGNSIARTVVLGGTSGPGVAVNFSIPPTVSLTVLAEDLGGSTGGNPTATAGPSAINGSAATFMRSDAAPAVQKASSSQFGIVEVDGTTVTASGGVITAIGTGANPTATAGPSAINGSAATFMRSDAAPAIQKASSSQFGIVEVDGTTITATGGVISATGGGGSPGGSSGQIQYNNSSSFGGVSGWTSDGYYLDGTGTALVVTGSELVTDGNLATDPTLSGWTLNDNTWATGHITGTLTNIITSTMTVQIPVTLAANTWYQFELHVTMSGDAPTVGFNTSEAGFSANLIIGGPQIYKWAIYNATVVGSDTMDVDFNFYLTNGSTWDITLISLKAIASREALETITDYLGEVGFSTLPLEYSVGPIILGRGAGAGGGGQIAIGNYALASTDATHGARNIAIGSFAMSLANSGSHNIGIGQGTLIVSTGDNNDAIGSEALYSNTTGSNNVAVGNNAMYLNTTGTYNTAAGDSSLGQITTGSNNVAVGNGAGYTSTSTGSNNIIIGFQADIGSDLSNQIVIGTAVKGGMNVTGTNTAATALNINGGLSTGNATNPDIVFKTGVKTSSGSSQATATTALTIKGETLDVQAASFNGAQLYGDSSGNTGLVAASQLDLAGGSNNMFIGANSLRNTTTGSGNVAIGYLTLYNNQTGTNNVMIGTQSGQNVTGGENVGLGFQSTFNATATQGRNTGVGMYSSYSVTSGQYNTFIGWAAGGSVAAGSANTWIGTGSSGFGPSSDVSSTIGIGTGDSTLRIDYNYTNAAVWTFHAPPVVPTYLVSALPTGVTGAMAYVTDADSGLAWGATAVNSGSGATKYMVWYNGANWTVMGK